MIALLTRKEGSTHEEFVKHWVEVHAPLAHGVPELRRYVQSHIIGEQTRPDIPATEVAIDGIAELWFDDRVALERAHSTPEKTSLRDIEAVANGHRRKRWTSPGAESLG